MGRVLIIGIDGATWQLLDPMLAAGMLPNLQRLITAGTRGVALSTEPAETPVAWVTFQTGVPPEVHGVYGFYNLYVTRGRPEFVANSSASIRIKTLWEYAGNLGKRVAVISCPITYPAYSVNGIMVPGFPAPSSRWTKTYPPALWKEIAQLGIGWVVPASRLDSFPKSAFKNDADMAAALRHLADLMRGRVTLALHLLNRHPWDLGFFQFQETDWVQHALWPYLADVASHPSGIHPALRAFYGAVDEGVGQLLRLAGPDDHIVLVSDHGFRACKREVFPNRWLMQWNLLAERLGPRDRLLALISNLRHTLDSRDLVVGRIPRSMRARLASRVNLSRIDTERSCAFMFADGSPTAGLFFLRSEDARSDHETVLALLRELADPDNGERIIEAIIPQPPGAAGGSPHYWVRFSPGYAPMVRFGPGPVLRSRVPGRDIQLGIHDPEGIFLVAGPAVRRGATAPRASLMDMAPTILHLLGLPVPTYMRGKVLASVFEEPGYRARPPAYLEDDGSRTGGPPGGLSATDEADITRRLRDLGYVD